MKQFTIRHLLIFTVFGALVAAIVDRQWRLQRVGEDVARSRLEAAQFALRWVGCSNIQNAEKTEIARRYILHGMSMHDVDERAGNAMMHRIQGNVYTKRYSCGLRVMFVCGRVVSVDAESCDVVPMEMTPRLERLVRQADMQIGATAPNSTTP